MSTKENDTKEKNAGKRQFLRSIKGKFSFLLITCVEVSVAVLLILVLPSIRNSMKSITQNYLYDITSSAGERLELAVSSNGAEQILNPGTIGRLVGDIGLAGIDSSYAYVVAPDGIMLYHPTESKIGSPVENAVITEVVAQLQAGRTDLDTQVVEYEFKGAMKYAAYFVDEGANFILVVSADEDEVLEPITRIMIICLVAALITIVICSIVGYLVAANMIRPVVQVTDVVNKLAHLDFTVNEDQEKLNRRNDETGDMSRAISSLRAQLADVVGKLKNHSEELFAASDSLNTNVTETATTMEQVEKAVAEISDGASMQADETQKATENVILIGNMIEDAGREVDSLMMNAAQMETSGEEASNVLMQLEQINRQAKEAIDTISEQTNTTNESAMKIREATTLITSIAEETNLLSLNASIEAARAGEQGRGFAVVASQIQKLAEQSNESAHQIENITDSLIADSEKAVSIMGEVQEIMGRQNENVTKTDKIFAQVKSGIRSSIDGVNRIADKTKKMDEARVNVVDGVQNLTAIAQENAASTEETSASTTEISGIIYSISENVTKMKAIADEMEQNMKIFKL